MKYAAVIFVTFLISAVSFGLLPQWPVVRFVPVGLLWVLAWAVVAENDSPLWPAIVAGLLADSYSGLAIGSFSIPFVLLSFLANTRFRHLFREGAWWHEVSAVMAAVLIVYVWVWLYSSGLFRFHINLSRVDFLPWHGILLTTLAASTILWYPMQWLARQLENYLQRLEASRRRAT